MLDNPYAPPCVADNDGTRLQKLSAAAREWPFWIRAAHVIALAYPVLLVGQFYASWLLAWVILGRQPRVSWDDPKDVLGMLNVFSCLVILFSGPAAGITGVSILARLLWPSGSLRKSILLTTLTVMVWLIAFALLQWDPLRVGEWWMD
jgi:hypothetical protein